MKGHIWLGSLAAGIALLVGSGGGAIAQSPAPAASAPEPQVINALPAVIQGTLQDGDAVLSSDNSLYDAYIFQGKAGDSVVIAMESNQFDTYLGVLDASGTVIGENDDSAQGVTNSRLEITLPRDGEYLVIANGFDRTSRGNYSLQISIKE
ncbi:MAG TPA: PPC domain-containing protein [Synechococcales cyanobacterium M55_K2018_004]|nr:PPC domain-containing protein [Synechococcales cyanobacterium M55_K2018_004]